LTACNNHTPHRRKFPFQESMTAEESAQNMQPSSFYPCKVYATCPCHKGLSLTVCTRGVRREVRLVGRNWCVVSVGGLSSRKLPAWMYKTYE
jgi:hypothetical protein